MKKTLVALAALAATSAFAQVTLSGRAAMDVSSIEASGSTAGGAANEFRRRTRVSDMGSRITFAANEDLGGGLKAGVYCETGLNIDTANGNGQAATANANTSEWCSREGRAYFGSNDAEIRLGRQNIYWTQGELNEVGSFYLHADTLTNLRNGGTGVYATRGENMIKVVAGAGMGAFANSEIYTAYMSGQGEAVAANTSPRGKFMGWKAQYSKDQILLMWDHQTSQDSATAAAAAGTVGANKFDRKADNYGVGFRYNPTSIVSFQYWNKSRTDATNATAAFVSPFINAMATANQTTAGSAKDSGYGLVVKHDLGGSYMFHGQYAKANALKDAAGTEVANSGAKAYSLGVTKHMSKRTHFMASYHLTKNESAAGYNMPGGNYTSFATVAQGTEIKAISLGMVHQF